MPQNNFMIHVIPGYIQNIFLMEYEYGLLLLDCGALNDVNRIEDYCRQELHRSPQEIKLAVVSHIHPDHAGGAVLLRKKFGIPLATHKDLDRWYAGPGGFIQKSIDCILMQKVARRTRGKLEKSFFRSKLQADYLLNDGDELPFFPDWTAVSVPGHTSHDLALYNARESLLYAGDCFLEVNGRYRLPLPVMFPKWLHASYAKLAALEVSTILLAHGQAQRNNIPADLFLSMQSLLQEPSNRLTHQIKRLSIYSPEWWRQNRVQRKARRHDRKTGISG